MNEPGPDFTYSVHARLKSRASPAHKLVRTDRCPSGGAAGDSAPAPHASPPSPGWARACAFARGRGGRSRLRLIVTHTRVRAETNARVGLRRSSPGAASMRSSSHVQERGSWEAVSGDIGFSIPRRRAERAKMR